MLSYGFSSMNKKTKIASNNLANFFSQIPDFPTSLKKKTTQKNQRPLFVPLLMKRLWHKKPLVEQWVSIGHIGLAVFQTARQQSGVFDFANKFGTWSVLWHYSLRRDFSKVHLNGNRFYIAIDCAILYHFCGLQNKYWREKSNGNWHTCRRRLIRR